MHRHLRATILDTKRASLHAWQDRLRDPSLTLLLVLQLLLMFVALPLAATGEPVAEHDRRDAAVAEPLGDVLALVLGP